MMCELIEVYLDEAIYEGECKVADLGLPQGATITIINREKSVLVLSG